MSGRRCVFCGGTPVTREHVLPQWLRDTPEGQAVMAESAPYEAHHIMRTSFVEQDVVVAWAEHRGNRVNPLHKVVKAVCKKCNGGWMSLLETQSGPILRAMNSGATLMLTEEDRKLLAKWAIKTAFMLQLDSPTARVVPEATLRAIGAGDWPLSSSFVGVMYLAAESTMHFSLCHFGAELALAARRATSQSNAGCTMVAAGRVVFVVDYTTLPYASVARPRVDLPSLHRLWPGDNVDWPPTIAPDDEVESAKRPAWLTI